MHPDTQGKISFLMMVAVLVLLLGAVYWLGYDMGTRHCLDSMAPGPHT
jgi:hypothetical protein